MIVTRKNAVIEYRDYGTGDGYMMALSRPLSKAKDKMYEEELLKNKSEGRQCDSLDICNIN